MVKNLPASSADTGASASPHLAGVGGIGNLGSSVGLEAAGAVSLVPGEGEEEGATLAAAAANGRPRAANGRPRAANGRPPLRAEAPSPPAPGEQVQHPRTASARRI